MNKHPTVSPQIQIASFKNDIEINNHCSNRAYSWAIRTFPNSAGGGGEVLSGSESAICSNVMNYGGLSIGMTSDGIGTKVELAERTGLYGTLGFDLVAMVTDDLICNGVRPCNISNILDVDTLDSDVVDALMAGLYEAAKVAQVSVTGGEIAVLGSRIRGWGDRMHFNWCATAIGWLPFGRNRIDGSHIRIGDAVVALESPGFRSNGFSLIRSILHAAFGNDWHQVPYDAIKTWGKIMLTPSLIYAPAVNATLDAGCRVHGMAHITGGGIPCKLGRLLRMTGYGAHLENLFQPLPYMDTLRSLGNVPLETAYHHWNMGNGMLLVVSPNDIQPTVAVLTQHGICARAAGKIVSDPVITIENQLHNEAISFRM